MYACAYTRVDADGADVRTVTAVAVDNVDRVLEAVQQRARIAIEIHLVAEHAAEIVAGAGGEWGDGNVPAADRAADALVEGAVSAAGVGADVLAGRCLGLYLFGRVQRRACDVYLILPLARGKGLFDLGANLACTILAAGSGVDDEQMLHIFILIPTLLSYLKYMKRSHFIMPLYSLRFLSACLPKQRSNSVCEESR